MFRIKNIPESSGFEDSAINVGYDIDKEVNFKMMTGHNQMSSSNTLIKSPTYNQT